jgi:hypothetical protein
MVRILLFPQFHAVASENQWVLSSSLEAMMVLLLDSLLEPFSLLLRSRIEQLIASFQLPLPRMILTFDSLSFAFPVQNQFCADCSLQLQ